MIQVIVGNNMKRSTVIVDENSTLRKVLEENNVDYAIGMTSLDGAPLGAGDLDKTFASFGVTEKCYLLNVVKADNAAKIKIAGRACVVESVATPANIKLLEKFRPKALSLFEGEGSSKTEVFRVGMGSGNGSIGTFGASFGVGESAEGKAVITLLIPESVTDPKKWAEDAIGVNILHLNKVEEQFAAALEEVAAEQAAVRENITVM